MARDRVRECQCDRLLTVSGASAHCNVLIRRAEGSYRRWHTGCSIPLQMKLTFRRREVKDLSQLEMLVTEHAEAIEPGFRVLASTVNFGRSTVELVGLDGRGTPALVALGLTGDDAMLFRIVEAYAWSLEYPESVRRLMPAEGGADGWPPRVVFIAERLPESFLRKIRLLTFPAVNCFEYRCVDVNGATGFYLDAVDWARSEPSAAASPVIPAEEAGLADDVRREATTAPQRAATEDAAPAVTRDTQPSHWFGLLKRPSETPTAEPSPGRAESPAPVAASGAPSAGAPAMAAPWKVASQPATPTDDAGLVRQLADNPEWQKFLEKLAAEDVPAATPTEKTARPAPEKQPTASHSGPSRNGGAGRRGEVKERLAGEPKERLAGEPKGREDRRQPPLRDVVTLPPNGELAPQWRKFFEKPVNHDGKIAVLREYLHREFPMCTIYDFHELQGNAQVLQLQDNQGKVAYLVTIMLEFFDAHGDSGLRTVLEKMGLSQAMRQAGQAGVLVTPSKLEFQKR